MSHHDLVLGSSSVGGPWTIAAAQKIYPSSFIVSWWELLRGDWRQRASSCSSRRPLTIFAVLCQWGRHVIPRRIAAARGAPTTLHVAVMQPVAHPAVVGWSDWHVLWKTVSDWEHLPYSCIEHRVWSIEQCLMSPPTQYRLYGRQFYRSKDPTNSVKVLKEKTLQK